MPLFRYFLSVGGVLLGLLFLADWYFPKPVSEASSGDIDRSIIRIHSARALPAAVQIDTSMPMPRSAPASIAAAAAAPERAAGSPPNETYAYLPRPTAERTRQVKRRIRSAANRPLRNPHPRFASSQPDWFSPW